MSIFDYQRYDRAVSVEENGRWYRYFLAGDQVISSQEETAWRKPETWLLLGDEIRVINR